MDAILCLPPQITCRDKSITLRVSDKSHYVSALLLPAAQAALERCARRPGLDPR